KPEVVRFTEEEYLARAGETFASISQAKFQSPAWAEALRLYNQNDALQGPPTLEKDGSIKAGAVVSIPELHILEMRYAEKVKGLDTDKEQRFGGPLPGGMEASSAGTAPRMTPTPAVIPLGGTLPQ